MKAKRILGVRTGAALLVAAGVAVILVPNAVTQGRGAATAEQIAARNATEAELESVAIVDRKVMVPMRDGKRMATDIYRPKDTSKKYPIVFVRTPYNFNFWDVRDGITRDMSAALDAIKHGYAYVEMNERGRYFSEGDYDILGTPLPASADAFNWGGALPCGVARA